MPQGFCRLRSHRPRNQFAFSSRSRRSGCVGVLGRLVLGTCRDVGMPHTDDELYAEADELFDELDKDSSGDLDRHEVVVYLVEYGYNDAEANALIGKMKLQGGGGQDTVSKGQFREIYAVFITDLAARGHDIAKREQDLNLARRGFPAAEIEAFALDFLLEVADHDVIELISELLAARWEEALRARGFSAQSAMEAALAMEIQFVEEEVLMIVRPEIAGRADEIRRLIDKKLAHKDITEKITKDVRRDLMIEVIEEELLSVTLSRWRALHPPAVVVGTESQESKELRGKQEQEQSHGAAAERSNNTEPGRVEHTEHVLAADAPKTNDYGNKSEGVLCILINAMTTLRSCARRGLQQPAFFRGQVLHVASHDYLQYLW